MERRLLLPVTSAPPPVPAPSQSASGSGISNPATAAATSLSNLASEDPLRGGDPNQAQVNVNTTAGAGGTGATISVTAAAASATQSKRQGNNREGEAEGGGGGGDEDPSAAAATKKKTKRRKVDHACVYCRRSHMTCDAGRPCQRCIKREIGHLCHDEVKPSQRDNRETSVSSSNNNMAASSIPRPGIQDYSIHATDNNSQLTYNMQPLTAPADSTPGSNWPIMSQAAFPYGSQNAANEFSVLTDFLQSLDDRSFFGTPQNIYPAPAPPDIPPSSTTAPTQPVHPPLPQQQPQQQQQQQPSPLSHHQPPPSHPQPQTQTHHIPPQQPQQVPQQHIPQQPQHPQQPPQPPASPILPAATKAEQFLLTAADQEPGSRDERLARVIHSKYEAGLLKPYNYVKGYARLSRWMDRNVSQESKQQILGPLSVLRPKFRAIAQSLTDMDLVFIEEAFERLLLDYDRVFSAMGIPACLWRRTGEIYKGNREFAELVGVEGRLLQDGKLCIYELMAEESAVNYWEKYGRVAFDTGQKAVLTSCVLRYKPNLSLILGAGGSGGGGSSTQSTPLALRPTGSGSNYGMPGRRGNSEPTEQGTINCCFSFTIRRDTWGIPSMIVGNFIRH